jgi:hypothetical protein
MTSQKGGDNVRRSRRLAGLACAVLAAVLWVATILLGVLGPAAQGANIGMGMAGTSAMVVTAVAVVLLATDRRLALGGPAGGTPGAGLGRTTGRRRLRAALIAGTVAFGGVAVTAAAAGYFGFTVMATALAIALGLWAQAL